MDKELFGKMQATIYELAGQYTDLVEGLSDRQRKLLADWSARCYLAGYKQGIPRGVDMLRDGIVAQRAGGRDDA